MKTRKKKNTDRVIDTYYDKIIGAMKEEMLEKKMDWRDFDYSGFRDRKYQYMDYMKLFYEANIDVKKKGIQLF